MFDGFQSVYTETRWVSDCDDPSKFNVDLLPIVRRRLDKFYETIVGDGGAV